MSASTTTDLLAQAADLIAEVLDDCDAHMAVRAGHGTGLISDLRRWQHQAAQHCPADGVELAPCGCPRRIGHRMSCIAAGRHEWADAQAVQA